MSSENVAKVFSQPQLREWILNYVIHDDDKVSQSDVVNCRLVNSDWLKSVNTCLRKSREPVFHFAVSSPVGKTSMKTVADSVAKSCKRGTQLPPVEIKLRKSFFYGSVRNFKSLTIHLPRIADGLVSLCVDMPLSGCPKNDAFCDKSISLPILQNFRVDLPLFEYYKETRLHNAFRDSSNLSSFMQSILSGCRELRSFTYNGYIHFNQRLPVDFQKLMFPQTLVTLNLTQALTNAQLEELMMEASLPNLANLSLVFPMQPFEENQLYRLMCRFSRTLKSLTMNGPLLDIYEDEELQKTVFKLPVMKSLETLKIWASNYEWSDDLSSLGIDLVLPNLKTVKLAFPGNKMLLRQWTENSRFLQVKDLTVSFISDDEPFTLNASRLLCEAFPNLQKFDIAITTVEVTGMLHIFHKMRQLTELQITVKKTCDFCSGTVVWDSILLGIPYELTKSLVKEKGFWNNIQFRRHRFPSITSMTKLRKLTLRAAYSARTKSLISDAVFHFGFMKMANLREVYLAGRFQASKRTVKKWKARRRGRVVKYRNAVVFDE